MDRASGILMHISSLPSPYGIGTLGKAAYEFADFLKAAGQKYWQLLPVGPTSYGDSPYQSFSSFAGNPYFIDLDMLIEDGLLKQEEVDSLKWCKQDTQVEYALLYENRWKVLRKASERGWDRDLDEVAVFIKENEWVDQYGKFMALKAANDMVAWIEWTRKDYDDDLTDDYRLHVYTQYLFFRQWTAFKNYVNNLGIRLIGDIPIYVPLDSADVWSEPCQFQLDGDNLPVAVSGVPPDRFSDEGQLWGTPLYDYEYMKKDGYSWWIRRIGGIAKMFDVIRIDHFRGFDAYWSVPYGSETAMNGEWIKGPGYDLVGRLTSWFSDIEFIAEDLGVQTDSLHELIEQSGWPNMKVLQFAFDPKEDSSNLPHRYNRNCVCYTGTHDNPTLQQWAADSDTQVVSFAREYCGISGLAPRNRSTGGKTEADVFNLAIIRAGMSSVANLFIAPMQDWLSLGREGLMNVPQRLGNNWMWRMKNGAATRQLAFEIKRMTETYSRTTVFVPEKSPKPTA